MQYGRCAAASRCRRWCGTCCACSASRCRTRWCPSAGRRPRCSSACPALPATTPAAPSRYFSSSGRLVNCLVLSNFIEEGIESFHTQALFVQLNVKPHSIHFRGHPRLVAYKKAIWTHILCLSFCLTIPTLSLTVTNKLMRVSLELLLSYN